MRGGIGLDGVGRRSHVGGSEISFYVLVLMICKDSSSFDRIYAHAVII